MTDGFIHEGANPRNRSAQKSGRDIPVLKARGRLKAIRLRLDHPQRRLLPESDRARRILGLVADHARLAYPKSPEEAVCRECRKVASWLTELEIDELIADSETSNKSWTNDQCAGVLGRSFDDQMPSGFRFIGCDDDLNYDRRRKRQDSNNAAAARKYRARNGASTRRGRPPLILSEADKEVRRAEDAARKRAERAEKSSGRPRGRPRSEGKCVQSNSSSYKIEKYKIKNMSDDELIRTDFQSNAEQSPVSERGAPEAPPPAPPRPTLIRLDGVPDGLIIDEDGHEFGPPPPYQRRPPPKTWMEAAFEGYTGGRS